MTEERTPPADEQEPQPPQQGLQAAPSPEVPADAEPQFPEAAPTDFRRNIWLLIIILGVVVLAWVVSLLSRPSASGAPESDSAVSGPTQPPVAPAAPQPAAPGAAEQAAALMAEPAVPVTVLGTNSVLIPASPAQQFTQEGKTYSVPARFFDVSQTAPGFEPRELLRLPGHWAGQRRAFDLVGKAEEVFQPAATVEVLKPQDRVLVVSVGDATHVYPLELMSVVAGALDVVGGRRLFVTLSPVTQLARCLSVQVDDKPVEWTDAGLVYRGNGVLFDVGTGSLWDTFSGEALTGPMSGRSVEMLPVQVWPWGQWSEAHPTSSTMNLPGAEPDKEVAQHMEAYLAAPGAPVRLAQSGPEPGPLPAKAFVLGLAVGEESRAYDLASLYGADRTELKDTVGGQEFTITVTSARTAVASSAGAPVDAPVMLWFGWKEVHPQTSVYGRAAPATPAGQPMPGPQPPATQQPPVPPPAVE